MVQINQPKPLFFNWKEIWYNLTRRHSALGYKTMEEFELINNNQRIAA
jgi:putative transposase